MFLPIFFYFPFVVLRRWYFEPIAPLITDHFVYILSHNKMQSHPRRRPVTCHGVTWRPASSHSPGCCTCMTKQNVRALECSGAGARVQCQRYCLRGKISKYCAVRSEVVASCLSHVHCQVQGRGGQSFQYKLLSHEPTKAALFCFHQTIELWFFGCVLVVVCGWWRGRGKPFH